MDGGHSTETEVWSLVVVVPEEPIDSPGACVEGKKATDVEAFIVDGAEEAFDFPIALWGVGAEKSMADAVSQEGLLEAAAASWVSGLDHGEGPGVVGHHGFDWVGQLVENPLEKDGSRRAVLLGGDPSDGFARVVVDGCKFEVVAGISESWQVLDVQMEQLSRSRFFVAAHQPTPLGVEMVQTMPDQNSMDGHR